VLLTHGFWWIYNYDIAQLTHIAFTEGIPQCAGKCVIFHAVQDAIAVIVWYI